MTIPRELRERIDNYVKRFGDDVWRTWRDMCSDYTNPFLPLRAILKALGVPHT